MLNPQNASCGEKSNAVCLDQLISREKVDKNIYKLEPDYNIEFTFGYTLLNPRDEFHKGKFDRYLRKYQVLNMGIKECQD